VNIWFSPGKLVVLGEYGVLDGAPARVFAVDHGVRCEVEDSRDLRIETPGSDDRFVRPALETAGAPPGTYRFVADPKVEGPKPGLGSSAAATVVAVAAARERRGLAPDPVETFRIAAAVHHRVQGSGSGIDVAASVYGGSGSFQAGVWSPAPTPRLPWRAVATPLAAATGPRVERYRAWSGRSAFVRACQDLDATFDYDPIGTTREAWRLLANMTSSAGIGYRTPDLDRVAELAEALGGAAKPSGAGGGDLAIAWFPDDGAALAFEAHIVSAGLRVLGVRMCGGVARRAETGHPPG
jgi:phosphomevalonate kinase